MTYLRGQQYFPAGLILPASLSHLNHFQTQLEPSLAAVISFGPISDKDCF